MKVTTDGKEVVLNSTYLMRKTGDAIFLFEEEENARITLKFRDADNKNTPRSVLAEVDPDNQGMTINLMNFNSKLGEGFYSKPYKLFESSTGNTYFILFKTVVLNDDTRELLVTITKEPS